MKRKKRKLVYKYPVLVRFDGRLGKLLKDYSKEIDKSMPKVIRSAVALFFANINAKKEV